MPEEPVRVVSVGVTEQDILLQLGVVPVAVTEWYGEKPFATWPWAEELLGDAEPEVLSTSDGFELERIAALQPDLIVGTNAGLTQKDYDLLSQIAPTIPSVEGSTRYFSSWQDQTLQVARALGREDDGPGAGRRGPGEVRRGRGRPPRLGGPDRDVLAGWPLRRPALRLPGRAQHGLPHRPRLHDDDRSRGLRARGGAQAEISAENVGLIDADVVVFATETDEMFDELQGFGTLSTLPAVAENRAVYTDETLAGAIYFDTPLSLEYALDRLTPMLELAARGQSPRQFPS